MSLSFSSVVLPVWHEAAHFLFIKDSLEADASFLFPLLMQLLFKPANPTAPLGPSSAESTLLPKNGSVVFVGLSQIFNHYLLIGRKLGINLAALKESSRLRYIDALSQLHSRESPDLNADIPLDKICEALYRIIESSITTIESNPATRSTTPCIFVDDLSVLQFLGVPERTLVGFVQACKRLMQEKRGLLAILCHGDPSLGSPLSSQIQHLADATLEVRGLESGHSQGVHGQISPIRSPFWITSALDSGRPFPQPHAVHYKLMDSGVQFFAKGLSQGVI
ncbi:uncharacterized protein BJ171DRAFT_29467 [Polychytrium aggregatum]|uniref:uncharacterized protein n=1 Tax=Polychytrium aggregatum TaxID=110093 RepID=UPI0022FDE9D8|nr:uncharacterized protein BJ171DRAFT_29467 [Polychytrium aggregatum]KAI9206385.1 hypothetical protein BJ171DRAFT_29467 [Polychytrium aggregatum]